eukprot:6892901-Lingulodinium_polyedra.AAC.1
MGRLGAPTHPNGLVSLRNSSRGTSSVKRGAWKGASWTTWMSAISTLQPGETRVIPLPSRTPRRPFGRR